MLYSVILRQLPPKPGVVLVQVRVSSFCSTCSTRQARKVNGDICVCEGYRFDVFLWLWYWIL